MTFSKDINIHAGIIRLIEMVLWMNAVTIGYDESERTNEPTNEHDVSKTSVHQVYVIHSNSVLCVSFSRSCSAFG